jgi:hypothetical protein
MEQKASLIEQAAGAGDLAAMERLLPALEEEFKAAKTMMEVMSSGASRGRTEPDHENANC